ncbi:MAG: hypothetical protein ACFFFT_16080 [Candidatus Thorarchaeota archaeon]
MNLADTGYPIKPDSISNFTGFPSTLFFIKSVGQEFISYQIGCATGKFS